jgi:hypothetical protein
MATQYSFGKIVTDGLVLCLDAADRNSYVSGSLTWRDVAGSNNGTLTNGPTFSSTNGGSIVFDGVDDYVGISTGYPTTSALTYQLWIKVVAFTLPYTSIISFNSWDVGYVHFIITNGILYFSLNGNTPTDSNLGSFPNLNTWYNLSVVYDSITKTVKLYTNGNLTNTVNYSTAISTTQQPYRIAGWDGGSRYLNGSISSTQIYNRALSAAEVLQNYNSQKSRFGLS